MSATLSPPPKLQFFDANGNPLVGGKLYSYTAGTTSPLATYVDSAGTTTNTNPVILDSRGEANVWLGAATYKLALYSATNVLIWTVDDITGAATDTLAVLAASGGSNLIGYLPAGTGAVATTVQTKLRESVSVRDFGAIGDGIVDDTAAIQAAITALASGQTLNFPTGTYKATSQINISAKNGITLLGERGAKLLFTDGSYVGLLFDSSSQRCKVENLMIWGTNTTSPTVTLVKATGNSAYLTIRDCNFAFASYAVYLAQSYVMKLIGNVYSNCDTYVRGTSAEGSTTDLLMLGETYGTSLIGTNALVDCDYIQTRLSGCYFETESHTKDSVYIRTGSQYASMTGCQISNSGRVRIGASNSASISGNTFRDTYASSSSIRVDGGSDATITGNEFVLPVLVGGVFGISCSGRAAFNGNLVNRYATGVSITDGVISGNSILNCTTGVAISAGQNVVFASGNDFSGNTTNITNSSTTAIAPGTFNGTLTGCTTSPTGSIRYEVNNGVVTLSLAGITGTSNTTDCTITGLPTAIQPAGGYFGSAALVLDNGVQSTEQCSVTSGTLTLYKNGSATGFTNIGTKGVRACVITYRLRNV